MNPNISLAKLAAQLCASRWENSPVSTDNVAGDAVRLTLCARDIWELSKDYKNPAIISGIDTLVLEANIILENYSFDGARPLHARAIANPDKTLELVITDDSFTIEIL